MLSWRLVPASKSKASWRVTGSTSAPLWRKLRRAPWPTAAGFGKRVAHAGGAAHGFDRLADALGGDARGAQRAQGAQLGQVFKGVLFVGGNQSGLLPRGQLARSQVQDSKDVLTAVSGHVLVSTGTVPMHLMRVCKLHARPARAFTVTSSNTRGYRVPNEVPPGMICGFRCLGKRRASASTKYGDSGCARMTASECCARMTTSECCAR